MSQQNEKQNKSQNGGRREDCASFERASRCFSRKKVIYQAWELVSSGIKRMVRTANLLLKWIITRRFHKYFSSS